jgi:polyhydroxybutyrate depolymerase
MVNLSFDTYYTDEYYTLWYYTIWYNQKYQTLKQNASFNNTNVAVKLKFNFALEGEFLSFSILKLKPNLMKLLYTLFISFLGFASIAQQTTESWMYDGQMREYIQYVPPIYDGSTPVPVVFAFHGLGDSMENMYGIGMNFVADTANFIVIVPQALTDAVAGTAWNSLAGIAGVYFPNETIDDVGFVMAMIDTLADHYNIDFSRIYATGFSMGGFFTNRLACEHPEVFAAVASVAGTIGGGLDCYPSLPIRIAHFHGTADQTVGYNNNLFGMTVPQWFAHWQDVNACMGEVTEDPLPNPMNDNFTIDYLRKGDCAAETEVVLYRVNGAGHIWLTPANDLFYTTEIWRFFLGVQPQFATGVFEYEAGLLNVFPNPVSDQLNISIPDGFVPNSIRVVDHTGRTVFADSFVAGSALQLQNLASGLYVVLVDGADRSLQARIIKN